MQLYKYIYQESYIWGSDAAHPSEEGAIGDTHTPNDSRVNLRRQYVDNGEGCRDAGLSHHC